MNTRIFLLSHWVTLSFIGMIAVNKLFLRHNYSYIPTVVYPDNIYFYSLNKFCHNGNWLMPTIQWKTEIVINGQVGTMICSNFVPFLVSLEWIEMAKL